MIVGASNPSNDRGVIFQLLQNLGVSDSRAHSAQVYAVGPLRILLILVLAFLLGRLVKGLSRRLVKSLRLVSPLVRSTPRGRTGPAPWRASFLRCSEPSSGSSPS